MIDFSRRTNSYSVPVINRQDEYLKNTLKKTSYNIHHVKQCHGKKVITNINTPLFCQPTNSLMPVTIVLTWWELYIQYIIYSSHLVGGEGLAGGTSSSTISSVDFFLTWVFHDFTSCDCCSVFFSNDDISRRARGGSSS
jgi:hypothetical protein